MKTSQMSSLDASLRLSMRCGPGAMLDFSTLARVRVRVWTNKTKLMAMKAREEVGARGREGGGLLLLRATHVASALAHSAVCAKAM
jgi:hypothetical protein